MIKEVKLEKLTLKNFKGIKSFEVEFANGRTNLHGANGTGKTTVFDSFTWCLFGKDHMGNTQFGIKTFDEKGETIDKLEHTVECVIKVTGKPITLTRTFREKWVKQRGNESAVFTGNETVYGCNGVQVKASEYQQKVSEIIDEPTFKLITNPMAFTSLKWQEQRKALLDMVGGLSDDSIAGKDKEHLALLQHIEDNGLTLDEYNAQTKASIKKANDELKLIPARIDEVQSSTPEKVDEMAIKKAIDEKEAELTDIDSKIQNIFKQQEEELKAQQDIKERLYHFEGNLSELHNKLNSEAKNRFNEANKEPLELQQQIDEHKKEASFFESKIQSLVSDVTIYKNRVAALFDDIEKAREDWGAEKGRTFELDEHLKVCPACNRELESDKIAETLKEHEARFNEQKNKNLAYIKERGSKLQQDKNDAEKELMESQDSLVVYKVKLEATKAKLTELEVKQKDLKAVSLDDITQRLQMGYQDDLDSIEASISDLKEQLANRPEVKPKEYLVVEKESVKNEIYDLRKQLSVSEQIKKSEQRLKELTDKEKDLSNYIASHEKIEFTISNFIKDKIEHLERLVNSKFKYVQFRMFEIQVNGVEKDTCEAYINGVPFSDANNAAKINAGIDIINTLNECYKASAPIFIDNAESTHSLIETDNQIIRLVVDENCKTLTVK